MTSGGGSSAPKIATQGGYDTRPLKNAMQKTQKVQKMQKCKLYILILCTKLYVQIMLPLGALGCILFHWSRPEKFSSPQGNFFHVATFFCYQHGACFGQFLFQKKLHKNLHFFQKKHVKKIKKITKNAIPNCQPTFSLFENVWL